MYSLHLNCEQCTEVYFVLEIRDLYTLIILIIAVLIIITIVIIIK